MSLLYDESVFSELNLHRAGARTSPHKVAMLLAVTDLVEDGTLTENRIEYSASLTSAVLMELGLTYISGYKPRFSIAPVSDRPRVSSNSSNHSKKCSSLPPRS